MEGSSQEMVCLEDFEKYSLDRLPKMVRDFYAGGASCEQTLRENREAFSRYRLLPRCLRDVSKRTLLSSLLGQKISFPVGISPSAMHKMAHPDGEIATARAASREGTVMVLSTVSSIPLEDVIRSSPGGLMWFQLYVYRDRDITRRLVERAEVSGYRAIVLTVDAPVSGLRLADVRNNLTIPPHVRVANFDDGSDQSFGAHRTSPGSALQQYCAAQFDPSLTWRDVVWLRSITSLPVVVKGILTGEDAALAVQHGAAAVMVSNHGCRQLDGVPASIEALPEVVSAVAGRCEVYLDGGVRTGTDVLKALALGANAVFIGRPALWGLSHSGEPGVRKVLQILRKELDTAMALSGCRTLADISSSMVVRDTYYSRL